VCCHWHYYSLVETDFLNIIMRWRLHTIIPCHPQERIVWSLIKLPWQRTSWSWILSPFLFWNHYIPCTTNLVMCIECNSRRQSWLDYSRFFMYSCCFWLQFLSWVELSPAVVLCWWWGTRVAIPVILPRNSDNLFIFMARECLWEWWWLENKFFVF